MTLLLRHTDFPPNQFLTCVYVYPRVPQRLLSELPEKEVQLSLLQALGQLVMKKSSPEGAAVVQEELRELEESWQTLRLLEENMLR